MKVSIKQYSQTLFDLTDGKSEQEIVAVVTKFTDQLKNDGQFKNAAKVIEKFEDIYNAKNGIVSALVTSARKLEEVQLKEITEFIKGKYAAKEVVIKNVVDEEIQGGLIVKVGDEVLDSSVISQLKRLQNILSK
jgi:F-type H+-transporting ATPase subunit delta